MNGAQDAYDGPLSALRCRVDDWACGWRSGKRAMTAGRTPMPADAEAGASTPMLMAKSGHASVASLARYARPSAEALARWQERHDPARRR